MLDVGATALEMAGITVPVYTADGAITWTTTAIATVFWSMPF